MSDAPKKTYEASDFLPAGRDEIASAANAGGRGSFFNVFFGRRDRIPPADDPRTRLIDRGMVATGFATPERLAELHTIGAEYDHFRPAVDLIWNEAARAGTRAVEADREERVRRKAEKKAAAAERKRLHAEGVAHRRATDIIFLGRGVSGLMNDRQSDVAKLEATGLPVLHTPANLAAALSLDIPRLRWLAFHSDVVTRSHYVRFTIPKRTGGERILSAPHVTLKAVQRWILAEVLSKLPCEPAAHGFVPARGIVSNATPHVRQGFVLNLDLKDFFPSVGFRRVRSVFRRAGYSGAVSTIFARLCTDCPRQPVDFAGQRYEVAAGPLGLPQGAPTSPAVSNLVTRKLDRRLTGFATKLGLTYTRYADDLTFSGPVDLSSRIGYVLAKVRHVTQDEGFVVNETKTRVMRPSRAMEVTGVVVNEKPSLRRDELRRLRAILHRAKTEGLEAQNRDGRPNFRAWLDGKIAFVAMVRPDVGAKLRAEFETIERERPI